MSTGENAHRAYRFGEFTLDLDREALYRGHRELHLRPKAFRVLEILLENSGRLVSKAELHEAAWAESVVTDDSLAHCIGDIRHTLGDSGFELIRTVPRRGYVFEHAVSEEIDNPAGPPPKRSRVAYQAGTVAAGLVATILLLLGAGRGDSVPAVAPGESEDAAVAFEVGLSVPGIDAHNESEKGRFFFKRRAAGDIERAEAAFKAALERAPDFAAAWIGLAGVYSVRLFEGDLDAEVGLPLLGDASRHAVRLAPDSAEAHVRRSAYYLLVGDHVLSHEHMEKAMALNPDDILVLGFVAGNRAQHGRFDEAIEIQRRAIQADPTSVLQHHNFVWMLLAAGRYSEADIAAEQYRALYPPGIRDEGELFADVELLQGNYEQALALTREMGSGPAQERNLAIIRYALGQHAEGDAALQRLLAADDAQARVHAAEVFARSGNNEEAMRQLLDAMDTAEPSAHLYRQIRRDTLWLLSPYLIGLRGDERWKARYTEVIEARASSKVLAWADDNTGKQRR